MFNRYFNDELRSLRELGREFAQKHPEAGRLLDEFAYDPDVERLLEGVAFLTGRLRQKLDDEIPELSHGLVHLLWPQYLRPTPCTSILEFRPRPGMVKGVQRIDRGVLVSSVPRDGTVCTFRTCYPVHMAPMSVVDVRVDRPVAGEPVLVLALEVERGAVIEPEDLPALRLHLHGPRRVSATLYYWLLRKVRSVEVAARNAEGRDRTWTLAPGSVQPVGWAREETLLEYGDNVVTGHCVLQEYFTLPEKFLFVDVGGLETVWHHFDGSALEIRFHLVEDLPRQVRPDRDHVRLHCTPIVNLFSEHARPIRLDPLQHEFRVQVDASPQEHYEVYAIEDVTSFARGTAERKRYRPVFELEDPLGDEAGERPAYMVSLKPAVTGEEEAVDTYISLQYPDRVREPAGDAEGTVGSDTLEYLSIDLVATNRHLPETLKVGDVCKPTASSPSFATFSNLLRPTYNAPPPLARSLLWHLISLLGVNVRSLGSPGALRSLLMAYQYPARRDRARVQYHRKLLAGLADVRIESRDALFRGHVVRGTNMALKVHESAFEGDGDVFLFGSVLQAYLAASCAINTFVALSISGVEQGLLIEWPGKIGGENLI